MDPLVLGLAVAVGVSLGLLGGGGSILLVPLLVYVGGVDPKQAIVLSLVVVGLTSAAGALPHARSGRVDWRTAGLFGSASMAGAYLGGRLGALLPSALLLGAFAVMMLVTAGAMLRGRREPVRPVGDRRRLAKVLAEGLGVGVVTGLVGAGGGFLVVPALVLLGGLSMPTAVGTSLVVIAMKSSAGVLGYLSGVEVDWGTAGAVATATVLGALLGARLVDRVPADRLRSGFGWAVLAMGGVVLAQEAPDAVVTHPLTWAVAGLALVGAVLLARSSTTPEETRSAPCADRPDASSAGRPRGPDAATTSTR